MFKIVSFLFHFDISQNKNLFEKLINEIFILFKKLIPLFNFIRINRIELKDHNFEIFYFIRIKLKDDSFEIFYIFI